MGKSQWNKEINVAAQEKDEFSVLNFYRKAIKLRKELSCVLRPYEARIYFWEK